MHPVECVGAAQYAITKADTRSWVNLPNTLQIAVVERPANGLLTISTSNNSHKAEIELPEGDNAMVLIKASGVLHFMQNFVKRWFS